MVEQGQAWLFWFRNQRGDADAKILFEPFTGTEGQLATANDKRNELTRTKITPAEVRLGLDTLALRYPAPPAAEPKP